MSALHRGHLHAGDRLPSTRQVAAEAGEDARAVARAYRVLEAEGLVEVRERSGIYVAPQAHVGEGLLEETAQWAARVLVEGVKRGIGIPGIVEFFRRCTASREVRCALVESCEDVVEAFAYDLREQLGLDVRSVRPDTLPPADPATGWREESVPPVLRTADLVVTTPFHAREVGPLADALGKPMIAATLNPEMVTAVERQLRNGGLTVVCADPGFGPRMRTQYHELVTADHPIRAILAEDARGIAALDPMEPVLLTRAARKRLGGVSRLRLVYPHSPTISSSSTLEIAECLVRFNLEAEPGQREGLREKGRSR